MNKEGNGYTFLFAAIMVVVVASSLAIAATSLKDLQQANVRQEKMQSILATIGVETDRPGAEVKFNEYMEQQLALRGDGTVDEEADAFTIKLSTEIKKPVEEQRFPLFVANVEGKRYYIIPLRGNGLWNAIFGYMSLEADANTVKGAIFDHIGETAGLGAEITKAWFQDSFVGEKIFDKDGNLMGVDVAKGNNDPKGLDKEDHQVDAISGATVTGDGVTDMIKERLTHYLPYLESQKKVMALN